MILKNLTKANRIFFDTTSKEKESKPKFRNINLNPISITYRYRLD